MKTKQVVIFTVVIALLLLAGGIWGGALVKQRLESNLVNNYTQEETLIGKQIAETLQAKVRNIENTFQTLAVNPIMQTGSTDACLALAKQVKANTTLQLNNIARVNAQGIFTCSLTNPALQGTPISNLGNYWQHMYEDPQHKPVLSHVIKNANVPDLAIAVQVPMYDAKHTFIGSVGGAFYLKDLAADYLSTVKFAKTGYASLQDDDGTILYSHQSKFIGKDYFSAEVQGGNKELADLNKAVLAAHDGTSSVVRYTNSQHVRKVASVVPVTMMHDHRWVIIVNVPLSEISETYVATGLNQAFGVLTGIFCITVLLISVLMILNILRDARLKHTEDQFISLVSHQLRTPLTAVRLFSEMLHKGQAGALSDKQSDYVDKIHISALRMIRLVGDILNVSRVELNRLSIQPTPTSIDNLIESYLDEVKPLADEKKVAIAFKPSAHPKLDVDQTLLGQVIHNLLTNAIRYSKTNSTVTVGLTQPSKDVEISVSDQGIGIPKGARKHIFQRFYRAENATQVVGEGTGLGLYLVKMILEQSGCAIRFESEEGKGTTFYVTIPATGMRARKGDKQLEKAE